MNKNVLASIVIIVFIIGVVAMALLMKDPQATFEHSEEAIGNPLMGYAPQAEYGDVEPDVSLLYVDVSWRELEPQEGVFDWETIEEKNQFERWRAEGKHIILRFVVDLPTEEAHLDIPDWLYEKIGHDGDWYDMDYGKGFSPNYANEIFIQMHQKAVEAMGQRWGNDPFVTYVQLGSIGHWGEWHVNFGHGIRRLPNEQIRERYVTPWISAFPQAKILMRRSFTPAQTYQLGLFNDMTGEPTSTQLWLEWIKSGGVYDQTGEETAIVPIPDVWKHAPIGGEFTSAISMEDMMGPQLAQTLDLIEQSHMTFIGPKTAKHIDGTNGYTEVLKQLGYRIWISNASIGKEGEQTAFTLQWQNSGAAPLYFDWPIRLLLLDGNEEIVEEVPVDLQLSQLQPEQSITTKTTFSTPNITKYGKMNYTVAVEIVDPMTNQAAVTFAAKGHEHTKRLLLFKKNN